MRTPLVVDPPPHQEEEWDYHQIEDKHDNMRSWCDEPEKGSALRSTQGRIQR